jgi:N4-gp56 family major capsid protein
MANLEYGNYTQGSNAGNKIPFDVIYDKVHLAYATQELMFDRFAESKFVPANAGVKKAFAFRYRNLLPATTPLTEGVLPAASNVYREKVEWTVAQYGSFITYTDIFDITDVDKVTNEFMTVLGYQAKETHDVIIRNTISNGNRVIYAGGAASRTALATAGSMIIEDELDLALLNLKNARAKKYKSILTGSTNSNTTPIRDAYIAITHPNVVNDLKKLPNWVGVEKYAYSKDIMSGEVGSYGEIRFIEDTNALVDESGSKPVYITLVFGKEAYASTTIRGKGGTETIHKPLSAGGIENALNQRGSIGWKMIAGAVILNQLYLLRIESCASLDVANLIRYGDSTVNTNITDSTPISGEVTYPKEEGDGS